MLTKTINTNTTAKPIKATAKQLAFLRQLGHTDDASGLTARQASELIEKLKQDAPVKATDKQVAFLRQVGYTGDVDSLTILEASEAIERLRVFLDEAKDRILASGRSVRDMADQLVVLCRETPKESSGPCPKCGGNDRFHCTDEWFFCRQCHDKRGDVIEFVMWKNNITFIDAIRMLDGVIIDSPPVAKRAPAVVRQIQPEDFSRKAAVTVDNAYLRLFDDNDIEAEAGRAYLDSRGIETHTWQAFKLGYAHSVAIPGTEGKQRAPAISMPWYRAGKVVAVRYRFLEKQGDHKQTALAGSTFAGVLYGGQALDTGIAELSTLIICEGEINATSIWQASRYTHLDVLSLGSEDAGITPAMIEYAACYSTVITWLDKENKALRTMTAFPGAYGIKSPDNQDANDLLQAGTLGGFLAMHRFQAARNKHEQERLYLDLWDTTRLPGGVDEATAQVIAHIGKTLN